MEASPRSEERGDDMQQSLTALPAEILNHILMWLDPESVMTASKVCRVLYHFIKGNQSLCRDVYLLWMVRLAPLPGTCWGSRVVDELADGVDRTSRMSWIWTGRLSCMILSN